MRQAAKKFREYWTFACGREIGEDQQFWNSLLGEVLGVEDVKSRIRYQVPVAMKDTTKFLDAWIPETRVLIEHKSRGVKLDASQSGHEGKTPYQQALEYNQSRGFSEKARWIVTSNFDEIWVYDMDRPLEEPQKLQLKNLPNELARLQFLVDAKVDEVRRKEEQISKQAGQIVAKLYDELLKRYRDPTPENLKALNRLCVRLVFCFYAEDAELFPKDCFWSLLKNTPAAFLRDRLLKLFRVLDTPEGDRDPYLEPELNAFPYTNGGLFKGVQDAEIPPLDEDIRALLEKSSDFDWRDISPTIFGALFESTLNPETRRAGGMVYTSVENIHKVIDPLFLGELTKQVEEATKGTKGAPSAKTRAALLALQEKMAALRFLDPACGSGNFLTETYLSLRRLENRLIAARFGNEREFDLGDVVKVKISQFRGIEINDFAVSVAKTAMWISEAKMLRETSDILAVEPKFLPLHDYDGIIEGNALRLDWPKAHYIMGNPPFVGYSNQSEAQKADAISLYRDESGKPYKTAGKIDYVACWYWKACEIMAKTCAKCAFVSTNSITQGEQVSAVWKPLVERFGLKIDFAWRTFRWDSESFEKAHVHCVIVGFHCGDEGTKGTRGTQATIFDGDRVMPAKHINGYLMDGPDVWIESRTKPICEVPKMTAGNRPADGGHLIIEADDYASFIKAEPNALPYIKRLLGSVEFINNKQRWCLWLKDATPAVLRSMPQVMKRIAACREDRLNAPDPGRQKLADTPHLFRETLNPESYVVVPKVSSERRDYVPIGFLDGGTIPTDLLFVIPSASLYHFGVLTSSVHMAWMRAVAGRLKSDYRYSANIVYNNFPWPDLGDSATLREKISGTAQAILDERAKYPDSALADLYDPLTMPPGLRKAHEANDRAVLEAYGLKPDTPEPTIIAHLFALYEQATKTSA